MPSTTFVDFVTPVPASWLNDVNTSTFVTVPNLALQVGSFSVLSTVAALRSLDKTKTQFAFVSAYATANDGGGGPYRCDLSDTTSADNGGTIIVASDGGRWKLQYSVGVSIKQFGAKGDGTTDDTVAVNAAMAWGGNLEAPPGTYKMTASMKFAVNNTWIQGSQRGATIFSFHFSGTSGLMSGIQTVTQLLYCRVSDCQFVDNNGLGKVIDFTDMQFCYLERTMTFGNGGSGSIGVYLSSTNTTLQCTYNRVKDHYCGNTQFGIFFHDGANANIIDGGRIQSPVSGAIGIILAPTAFNLVNGNLISGIGIEQPGNTLTGIQLNGNTGGTTIVAPRFEALLLGILVSSTDVGVTIINPIYSDCTTNILDISTATATQVTSSGVIAPVITGKLVGPAPVEFNFVGSSSSTIRSVNCSITRVGVGQYTIIITNPFAAANFCIGISSSQPQTVTTINSNNSVSVGTFNSAGTATDATISGTMWG